MRRKKEAVSTFEWNNGHLSKVVREEREKYKNISQLPDDNPEILDREHRFHDQKIKRLHLFVTRYCQSTSKKRRRQVEKAMRRLVERVAWIVEIARQFCRFGRKSADVELQAVATELDRFLPAIAMTVDRARRRARNRAAIRDCPLW